LNKASFPRGIVDELAIGASAGITVLEDIAPTVENVNLPCGSAILDTDKHAIRYVHAMTVGTSIASGGENQECMFEFDLSGFVATLFAVDKNLFFGGESLLMQLWFNGVSKFVFQSTAAADALAPAANAIDLNPVYLEPYPGAITMSLLQLYLCVEGNQAVADQVTSLCMGGYQLNIPFVNVQRNTFGTAGFTYTNPLSSGLGRRLLFVAIGMFNTTETGETAQDHSLYSWTGRNNARPSMVTNGYSQFSYNTFLDSVPIRQSQSIQVYSATGVNGEHWLYNRHLLEGSTVSSRTIYEAYFAHIDSFCGSKALCDIDFTVEDGMPLRDMTQYSFTLNGTAGGKGVVSTNFYAIYVYQKRLAISAQGIQVM